MAPEKGPKWQAEKGQQCGYGMDFSSAAQSRRRLGHSDSVAVRQLELPYGNRTIFYYGCSNGRAERDHQIIIYEMLTRVKRNIRNDVIFFVASF